MAEEVKDTQEEETTEEQSEKTFTQAEVDALIARRVAREKKGMPSAEELEAFRTWQSNQQTDAEKITKLTGERDTAQSALSTANAKIEQYERERFLLQSGIPADDVDYYAFKIGKLVTDDKPFEEAAKEYLKEHTSRRARVDTSASVGGGTSKPNPNDAMNDIIRNFRA